jgi:acetate kinase
MRARIVEKLAWLGAVLDPRANSAGELSIAAPNSRIGLYIIPTDEELMIARHTMSLVALRGGRSPVAVKG